MNKNDGTDDLADMGVQGFGILGTNAVSAIPKIDENVSQRGNMFSAAQALSNLEPERDCGTD